MNTINNKVIYFKNLENLDDKLIRFIHKDDKSLYVTNYSINESVYTIKIRDINGLTGEDIFYEFNFPKNKVKDIEELY